MGAISVKQQIFLYQAAAADIVVYLYEHEEPEKKGSHDMPLLCVLLFSRYIERTLNG